MRMSASIMRWIDGFLWPQLSGNVLNIQKTQKGQITWHWRGTAVAFVSEKVCCVSCFRMKRELVKRAPWNMTGSDSFCIQTGGGHVTRSLPQPVWLQRNNKAAEMMRRSPPAWLHLTSVPWGAHEKTPWRSAWRWREGGNWEGGRDGERWPTMSHHTSQQHT